MWLDGSSTSDQLPSSVNGGSVERTARELQASPRCWGKCARLARGVRFRTVMDSTKPTTNFDVIVRRDGGWCLEQWTEADWLAWLDASTPAQLARHILRWTELIEKAPELRHDLHAATVVARHRLRLPNAR